MTLSTESTSSGTYTEIRQAQLAQADDLKVIKGQLADLPVISSRLATTRMAVLGDIGHLREQVAELPGIRTRLETQERELAEIKELLATLVRRTPSDTTDGRTGHCQKTG